MSRHRLSFMLRISKGRLFSECSTCLFDKGKEMKRRWMGSGIFLTASLMLSGMAQAALTDGLVGYWSFDKCDVQDSSGQGNNGKFIGSPKCITERTGKTIELNQSNYAEIPDSASLDLSSAFTLSVFFNAYSLTVRPTRLIDKITAGMADGYGLDVGLEGVRVLGIAEFKKTPISTNVFHHAVVTFSQGTAKMYLDGQLVDSKNTGIQAAQINSLPLRIGASQGALATVPDNFNGVIDEVRIHNRALSDMEIQQMYSGSASCSTTSTTSSGNATYSGSTGMLNIPAVDVPGAFGGTQTYTVDLQIVPGTNPFQFKLINASPK